MRRGGVGHDERVSDRAGAKVVVAVAEQGEVEEEGPRGAQAVPGLVGDQLLGAEVVLAEDGDDDGDGARRDERRQRAVHVEDRRGAHRARAGEPDHVGLGRPPGEAQARLVLEAAVIVVLELRADGEAQPLARERDLVLDERGVEVVAPPRRVDGEDERPL